jgi:hypothetical protein
MLPLFDRANALTKGLPSERKASPVNGRANDLTTIRFAKRFRCP